MRPKLGSNGELTNDRQPVPYDRAEEFRRVKSFSYTDDAGETRPYFYNNTFNYLPEKDQPFPRDIQLANDWAESVYESILLKDIWLQEREGCTDFGQP